MKSPRSESANFISVPFVIAIVAAATRFYHLAYHDLRGDEAFAILFAESPWPALLAQLSAGEPHPPLYFSLLKIWGGIAGETELAARWLSAAAGIVTVLLVYRAAGLVAGRPAALSAAVLALLSPTLVWNAQDARMYSLATSLCALVLYWGLRVGTGNVPPARYVAASLAASSVLALYSHYVAATVVGAVYCALFLNALFRGNAARVKSLRLLATTAVATAALFVPWLLYGISALGPAYRGNFRSPDFVDAVSTTTRFWFAGELPAGVEPALFLVPGTILLLMGGLALVRRQNGALTILLGVLLVPFLSLYVAASVRPVFSERYLLPSLPAAFVLLGVGVDFALRRRIWPTLVRLSAIGAGMALVATIVGASLLVLGPYYRDRAGEGPGNWRPHLEWVTRAVTTSDLILVNHLDPTFHYYYRLFGGAAETAVTPPRQGASDSELEVQLRPLLIPGRRLLFAQDTARLWDPQRRAAQWLAANAIPVATHEVAGKEVLEFRVPGGEEVAVAFGNNLTLSRFEIRSTGDDLVVGGQMIVDLVWEAKKQMVADCGISLQLVDKDGRLVSQRDGPPREGQVRTNAMPPGQPVIDTRSLTLPAAAGSYRLGVAVYDYATGARLSVAGTTDNLAWLTEITVGR